MMYWSYILAVIGVAGIYFVGRKTIWGWFVILFNEVLWIAYALITDQYGFILSAIAYAVVYIRSYMHWSNDKKLDINKLLENQRDFE
jgi:nicotinamide riboside transporter PnuC